LVPLSLRLIPGALCVVVPDGPTAFARKAVVGREGPAGAAWQSAAAAKERDCVAVRWGSGGGGI